MIGGGAPGLGFGAPKDAGRARPAPARGGGRPAELQRGRRCSTPPRALVLAIQPQPGTNTVEVVDSIRRLLPTFRVQMPASIELAILYDRSVSIRDSVNDVQVTLFLSICLVVLVIFLFLRNLSATLIPSLAVPMSIVGTFTVMYLMGYMTVKV